MTEPHQTLDWAFIDGLLDGGVARAPELAAAHPAVYPSALLCRALLDPVTDAAGGPARARSLMSVARMAVERAVLDDDTGSVILHRAALPPVDPEDRPELVRRVDAAVDRIAGLLGGAARP